MRLARHHRPLARRPLLEPVPRSAVVGYFVLFLLLDWASFIRPLEGLNITPWNPQPALAVALLLASPRLWWAVLGALVAAEVLVRGMPGDLFVVVLAAGALTASYLAMAAALARSLGDGWGFQGGRHVASFLGIVAAGSLFSAAVYVGTYAAGGYVPVAELWAAVARYWVGDAVGLTVTLPILLAGIDATRRERLIQTLRNRQAWGIGLVIALLLGLIHAGGDDGFNLSYLLLLPAIGAAMRFGAAGAVLASLLTQVGLIVTLQAGLHDDRFVFELQLLMVAITTTALLLGVVVDERQRTDAELRRTLRLAAAGHMSAALAHELGQPLHAMGLYAQACELLASRDAPASAESASQLLQAARRMAAEARRAGEVVRRLRDFFRTGDTRLQPVPLSQLIEDAVAAQAGRLRGSDARIDVALGDAPPLVWVDMVQMQVVLRNLLANALDAAHDAPASAAGPLGTDAPALKGHRVPVSVSARVDADEVLIVVADRGPGLSAAQRSALFDGTAVAATTKPGGMGVGLGICRAIIEAHGGRLWAEAGPGGRLCFTLPLGNPLHDGGPSGSTPP